MSQDLKGMEEMKRALRQSVDRCSIAIGAGLYAVCNNIVSTSATELCPIDTGNLRRSHYVTEPEISSDSVTVEFGCGGTAEPYAIEVHENMTARRTQGGPKFLELAMNAESVNAAQNAAAIAAHAFEQGAGHTRDANTPTNPNDHDVKQRTNRRAK